MSKLLSVLIAAAFATVSVGSFAASHGGAAKDDKKMEEKKPEAKKDEKKAEAKKDDKKPEAKKDDKKPAEAKKEEPKK